MPKDKLPDIELEIVKQGETIFEVQPDVDSKAVDVFMRYILYTELPKGISQKVKIGKIEGINSNVLKNLSIWLYSKGYDENTLKEEIKPIYNKRGWAFGDLWGWFKKARKGDIKEINKGELYNWCKTYAPELTRLLNLDTAELLEHDFGKEDVERDYALKLAKENKSYGVISQWIKDHDKYAYRQEFTGILAFHALLGQKIKDIFIYKEKMTNGNIPLSHPIDLRINLILMRPSGTGKSVGLDFFNNVVKGIELVSRQPSDFTDAGLIGSVDKPDKFGPNITYGIFKDSDFITFDEAEILFENNPHKENTLRRFNIALNTYKQASQLIYKRMRWGELSYNPHFSTYFVSVPFFGFEEKLKSGFPQRHLVFIEDEVINERLKSLREDISRISFTTSPDKREKLTAIGTQTYTYWKEIFENLQKFAAETQFKEAEDVKDYIERKIKPLFKETEKIKSNEVQGIMFSFLARYLDHLYRLVFHSAIIRQSSTIEKIDVDYAFSIIKKTYMSILYYIEVNTKTVSEKLQDKVITYIYSLMTESNPRIRAGDLIKSIQSRFKISQTTAYTMVNEYISKKQILKEDRTKGSKERFVYYKRGFIK